MIDQLLNQYLEQNVEKEPQILKDLWRTTHIKCLYPNMLSGHVQGRFLKWITQLKNAKDILEIGTYTGYSTLCFAEGMALDGSIDTIDINEETMEIAKEFAIKAGVEHQINFYTGDAMEIIPNLNKKYDLVFIDADKERYREYVDLVFPFLNKNALILVDNVLWYGKVYSESEGDLKTQKIKEFNNLAQEDERFTSFLLPLRDGVYMMMKK